MAGAAVVHIESCVYTECETFGFDTPSHREKETTNGGHQYLIIRISIFDISIHIAQPQRQRWNCIVFHGWLSVVNHYLAKCPNCGLNCESMGVGSVLGAYYTRHRFITQFSHSNVNQSAYRTSFMSKHETILAANSHNNRNSSTNHNWKWKWTPNESSNAQRKYTIYKVDAVNGISMV